MPAFTDLLDTSNVLQLWGLAALAGTIAMFLHYRNPLANIPTAGGPDFPLISYWGTIQFFFHGRDVLREGYTRYRGRAFKIATLDRWMVFLPGKELIDELKRLPEHIMSGAAASNEILNLEHTMGREVIESDWHVDLIRVNLTKQMDDVFPNICDEVATSLNEYIPLHDDGWVAVHAADVIQNVAARATNRLFVGSPLCRNSEWIKMGVEFTRDVFQNIMLSQLFPSSLKFLVGRFLSAPQAKVKHSGTYLNPMVLDRKQKLQAEATGHGYPDKPNDLLMWMLEHRDGSKAPLKDLATRILALSFASIHSTSVVTLHTLYTMAARPEHTATLREEAETIIKEHGWTKKAMVQLVKLDSYLKEASRFRPFLGITMVRMAMQPYTFSDGTAIPTGTIVAVSPPPVHNDEDLYEGAADFDPWRFLKGNDDEENVGQSFTTTSNKWLLFGGGKHACPGRFFASYEIKLIIVQILLHFDVKTEVEGVRPKDLNLATECFPSRGAKLLFRKRQQ